MYEGEATTSAILRARAQSAPSHAIVTDEDRQIDYRTLDRHANRIANALADYGLKPGDRVAIQLPNGPEFLAVWFGIGRAGMVEVPLNVGLHGELLADALNRAACRLLVISTEWSRRISAIAAALTEPPIVVIVDGGRGGDDGSGETLLGTKTTARYTELLTADDADPQIPVAADDPAIVIYTSGTTGPSKGVVLSHNATFFLSRAVINLMEYSDNERLFSAFPLFHTNAKYTTVLAAMLMDNGSAVLHSHFSASRFWEICREQQVSAFNFMGALILMLYKQPPRDNDNDNPVRCGWGAPAPVDITPEFERRFDVILCESYGSTELGMVTGNSPSKRKLGSCGRPTAGLTVAIHDERGAEVADGQVGEIVVRPQRPHIIVEEYFGMPEATLKAFRGLWFHTGDRGRRDDDGWFYYVDRIKDAIRRRGENISSWEVEQALNAHPAIAEAAVIGVPSELGDEEVLALVILKSDQRLTAAALVEHAQRRLPSFAVPRYVQFTDRLPKNPQQRIEKYVLRARGLPADAWDRQAANSGNDGA